LVVSRRTLVRPGLQFSPSFRTVFRTADDGGPLTCRRANHARPDPDPAFASFIPSSTILSLASDAGGIAVIAILAVVVPGSVLHGHPVGHALLCWGRSHWTKAQKRPCSTWRCMRTGQRGRNCKRFQEAIQVNLGDQRAREQLEQPAPNYAMLREGFIAGGNHPTISRA